MKTYHGSCHCGRVRFEVDLELERTSKCNCRFCWKQRNWNIPSLAPSQFRLVEGEAQLGDYARSGEGFELHHRFCRTCGTATHGHGFIAQAGGAFVAVRVAALDNLDLADLLAAPVTYGDGLNDNWWEPPSETRHL
ncbi:GFA family protein [Phenylobacterium sp. J426]|uniref:GFA family protein n=1 Tax=Phenylobacterium sp. J426 TaxID=2898439 RepID=UPI002151AE1D|nr:GFA family protein [Phenylobacterium sp. J426]MCR5876410.1 GFA family protein [Phenylobacterium sp. J426]